MVPCCWEDATTTRRQRLSRSCRTRRGEGLARFQAAIPGRKLMVQQICRLLWRRVISTALKKNSVVTPGADQCKHDRAVTTEKIYGN